MASESFKGSELDLDDTESGTDNALPTSDVTGNGMDLSAGVYYSKGNWYAGLSITHITAPTITYSSSDNNSASWIRCVTKTSPLFLAF